MINDLEGWELRMGREGPTVVLAYTSSKDNKRYYFEPPPNALKENTKLVQAWNHIAFQVDNKMVLFSFLVFVICDN